VIATVIATVVLGRSRGDGVRGFETAAQIESAPDAVWAVLVDGAGWTSWDSAVVKVDGTIAPGEKVTVYPEVNPKRGFPVKVVEFEPGRRMTWRGSLPLGLFTGTRTYVLTPQDGGTRFEMREEYTGPMAGLIFGSVPDLQPSFDRFAAGLKARAEQG
jgi:hypothetical protein